MIIQTLSQDRVPLHWYFRGRTRLWAPCFAWSAQEDRTGCAPRSSLARNPCSYDAPCVPQQRVCRGENSRGVNLVGAETGEKAEHSMYKRDAHRHSRIRLHHKTQWNNALSGYMDATRDYHMQWGRSEREGQIPYDITYTWPLKYDTNKLICKTERESRRHREQICGCQGGRGGSEIDWEFGVSRGKLLYIGWVNSKVLPIAQGIIFIILW